MTKQLGGYNEDDFDTLINLIERVPGHRLDVQCLMQSLQSFLSDFGQGEPMTDAARLWAEADDAEKITPKQAVLELKKLLSAGNPLAPGMCHPALRPHLNAKIRRRWKESWREKNTPRPPGLTTVEWDRLTEDGRGELKGFIKELRMQFDDQVRRGPHVKDRLDTALEEIAEIWIEQTGWNKSIYELSDSENSRFIRFASKAMRPCGAISQTSRVALARRWERQKKHHLNQGD